MHIGSRHEKVYHLTTEGTRVGSLIVQFPAEAGNCPLFQTNDCPIPPLYTWTRVGGGGTML